MKLILNYLVSKLATVNDFRKKKKKEEKPIK